jgi:mannose-6-phosphate isomerase-like protein (cupin superfamily)
VIVFPKEHAMRKVVLGVFVGLLMLTAADTKPASATYITNATLQSMLKSVPADAASDQQVRVVDTGKENVAVGIVYRSAKANNVAVEHDDVAEIYQILEGAGTMLTGGMVIGDGKTPTSRDSAGPSGPSMRGPALRGAESHKVGPGDIVIIPAGVGHQFSSIDGMIKYVVVRADSGKVLPLK